MVASGDSRDAALQKKGRRLALMIAGAAVAFVAVEAAGAALGWSGRTMALLELIVLGVFAFAVINAIMIWRKRRADEER